MHRSRQRPSAVLVLALLLMGSITASTIALSTVIADSTVQTRTLNDFITASLVADSGIERGLAVVKAGRAAQSFAATTAAVGTVGDIGLPTGLTATAANSGGTDKFTWLTLKPRESVTFDILNYDTSGNLVAPTTKTIQVTGKVNNVPGYSGQGALDVSWVGLNTSGVPFYSGRTFLSTAQFRSPAVANIDLQSLRTQSASSESSVDLNLTRGFRIRVTAIDRPDIVGLTSDQQTLVDTVSNLVVTSTNQAGVSTGFPSRINITSTGLVGQSQSEKSASVLWQLPASGVFNYVLFTEGNIIPQ